jgi:hypothetical protein
MTNPVVRSYELGFHRYFTDTKDEEKMEFQNMKIVPNDISNLDIERSIC